MSQHFCLTLKVILN